MMTSCRTSQTTVRDNNSEGDIANGPGQLYDPLLSKISVDFGEAQPIPIVIENGRRKGLLRRVWNLRLPLYIHLIAFLVYGLVMFVSCWTNESHWYRVEPYCELPARRLRTVDDSSLSFLCEVEPILHEKLLPCSLGGKSLN